MPATAGQLRRAVDRMRLPIVPGHWVREMGWWPYGSLVPYEERLVQPIGSTDYAYALNANKPTGGLWTSPVTRHTDGRILSTDWTRLRRHSGPVWTVHAKPDARVFVVNKRAHLLAAIERWPERDVPEMVRRFRNDRHGLIRSIGPTQPEHLCWEDMAKEVDAFWLTGAGLRQTCNIYPEPNLWGWDVPTVLFFHPDAYTIEGPFERPPTRERIRLLKEAGHEHVAQIRERLHEEGKEITAEVEHALDHLEQFLMHSAEVEG